MQHAWQARNCTHEMLASLHHCAYAADMVTVFASQKCILLYLSSHPNSRNDREPVVTHELKMVCKKPTCILSLMRLCILRTDRCACNAKQWSADLFFEVSERKGSVIELRIFVYGTSIAALLLNTYKRRTATAANKAKSVKDITRPHKTDQTPVLVECASQLSAVPVQPLTLSGQSLHARTVCNTIPLHLHGMLTSKCRQTANQCPCNAVPN